MRSPFARILTVCLVGSLVSPALSQTPLPRQPGYIEYQEESAKQQAEQLQGKPSPLFGAPSNRNPRTKPSCISDPKSLATTKQRIQEIQRALSCRNSQDLIECQSYLGIGTVGLATAAASAAAAKVRSKSFKVCRFEPKAWLEFQIFPEAQADGCYPPERLKAAAAAERTKQLNAMLRSARQDLQREVEAIQALAPDRIYAGKPSRTQAMVDRLKDFEVELKGKDLSHLSPENRVLYATAARELSNFNTTQDLKHAINAAKALHTVDKDLYAQLSAPQLKELRRKLAVLNDLASRAQRLELSSAAQNQALHRPPPQGSTPPAQFRPPPIGPASMTTPRANTVTVPDANVAVLTDNQARELLDRFNLEVGPTASTEGSLHQLRLAYHRPGTPRPTKALASPSFIQAFRSLKKAPGVGTALAMLGLSGTVLASESVLQGANDAALDAIGVSELGCSGQHPWLSEENHAGTCRTKPELNSKSERLFSLDESQILDEINSPEMCQLIEVAHSSLYPKVKNTKCGDSIQVEDSDGTRVTLPVTAGSGTQVTIRPIAGRSPTELRLNSAGQVVSGRFLPQTNRGVGGRGRDLNPEDVLNFDRYLADRRAQFEEIRSCCGGSSPRPADDECKALGVNVAQAPRLAPNKSGSEGTDSGSVVSEDGN